MWRDRRGPETLTLTWPSLTCPAPDQDMMWPLYQCMSVQSTSSVVLVGVAHRWITHAQLS